MVSGDPPNEGAASILRAVGSLLVALSGGQAAHVERTLSELQAPPQTASTPVQPAQPAASTPAASSLPAYPRPAGRTTGTPRSAGTSSPAAASANLIDEVELVLSDARERAQAIIDESTERARELIRQERATSRSASGTDAHALDDLRSGLRNLMTEVRDIQQRLARIEHLIHDQNERAAHQVAQPQHAEPQYAEPQYAEPQYAEPQYAEPQYAEPQYAEPQYAEPQYAEPQHAEPQHAEPQHAEPQYAEPHADPQHVEPQYAEPQYAEPQHAEPQYTEPQHAEPQHAEPQYAEPQYAEPQYAEPQYAEPQYAEPAGYEAQYAEPAGYEAERALDEHEADAGSDEQPADPDYTQAPPRSSFSVVPPQRREWGAPDALSEDTPLRTPEPGTATTPGVYEPAYEPTLSPPRTVAAAAELAPEPDAWDDGEYAQETSAGAGESPLVTFLPSDGSITLRVAPVAGFQGLMRVQEALTRLPAVRTAAVDTYSQGEARLHIELADTSDSDEIAAGLSRALGGTARVEDASEVHRELFITLR